MQTKSPLALPLQDAILCRRDTVEETKAALKVFFATFPFWSYNTVREIARAIHSGDITRTLVHQTMMRLRAGAKENAEVGNLLFDYLPAKSLICNKPRLSGDFTIAPRINFLVKPNHYFVESGRLNFFFLQPRKGSHLSDYQRIIHCSAMSYGYHGTDFEGAHFLYFDAGSPAPGEPRQVKLLAASPNDLLDDAELGQYFQNVADALMMLESEGYKRPERPKRTTNKQPDEAQLNILDHLDQQ